MLSASELSKVMQITLLDVSMLLRRCGHLGECCESRSLEGERVDRFWIARCFTFLMLFYSYSTYFESLLYPFILSFIHPSMPYSLILSIHSRLLLVPQRAFRRQNFQSFNEDHLSPQFTILQQLSVADVVGVLRASENGGCFRRYTAGLLEFNDRLGQLGFLHVCLGQFSFFFSFFSFQK